MTIYNWTWRDYDMRTEKFFDVGILPDGTLHNPNGYPEDAVRAAVMGIAARHAAAVQELRRERAAKSAATRARRKENKVNYVATRMAKNEKVGPRHCCAICNRKLTDPPAIERGVGPECWDYVKAMLELLLSKADLQRAAIEGHKVAIRIEGVSIFDMHREEEVQ